MKIGILGGTFNPIHNGHIEIALKIQQKLGLYKVLFMPNKNPPHKDISFLEQDYNRVNMIKLAINNYNCFSIEEYELGKDSISYTCDSLEYLQCYYRDDELYFIVGSDSFLDFNKWKNIYKIFKTSSIVVYLREDFHKELVFFQKKNYEKLFNSKIHIFIDDIIKISSTDIRKKILNMEDIGEFLDSKVINYIKENNLYGE